MLQIKQEKIGKKLRIGLEDELLVSSTSSRIGKQNTQSDHYLL